MKVRTRLVASFAYVLLVVIVALTVPLAIVLRDRARSELEALALTNAQTVAAVLNQDRLDDDPADRRRLERDAARYAADVGGRVVVLDTDGTVLVDSAGEDVGKDFATAGRPEVAQALDSQAVADVRRSDEEGGDIAVGAAPIIDEGELVGAVRISRGVQTVQENVGRATAAIAAVALGGLVAGLVLAVALARSIARPMTRLATTARSFGEGELSSRAGPIEGGRGGEGAGALLRRDGGADRAYGSLPAGVRRERLPPAPHPAHGHQAAARGRDRRHDRSEDPRGAAGGRSGGRSARADHRAAAHDGDAGSRRGASHGPTWAMPSIGRSRGGASERPRRRRRSRRRACRTRGRWPTATTSIRSSTS